MFNVSWTPKLYTLSLHDGSSDLTAREHAGMVDTIATLDGDSTGLGARSPGDYRIAWAQDLAGSLLLHVTHDHGTAGRLIDAPGRTRIVPRQLLDNRDIAHRVEFGAADPAGQEKAEETGGVQGVDDVGGELRPLLGVSRTPDEDRGEIGGALQVIRPCILRGGEFLHRCPPL